MSLTPVPASTPPEPPPASAPPSRPLLWRLLHGTARTTLATVLALGAGAAGLAGWVWQTPSGTAWALNQVPGLQLQDLQGALGQGQLTAKQLRYSVGGSSLQINAVQLQGLRWHWHPQAQAWVGVSIASLQADRAQWHSGPSSGRPAPTDLHLPLELAVDSARVAQLQVDALPVITEVQAALHLGADGGQAHTLTGLRLQFDKLQAQADLRIATSAPLPITADAKLSSLAGAAQAWQAELHTQGPLDALQTRAHLSGQAPPGGTAPSLDAEALLHPLAAWPLGPLTVRTQALNLAALHSAAPKTLLNGEAHLDSAGLQKPLQLRLQLRNAAPGRWDLGALPLATLALEAVGEPASDAAHRQTASLEKLRLLHFSAELSSQPGDVALVSGSGQWLRKDSQTGEARASFTLTNLHPSALDKRLAPMHLAGPMALTLQGLPPPDWLLGVPAPASLAPQLVVDTHLRGRLDVAAGGSPEVALRLDATLSPQRISLRELKAQAAGALASLQGELTPLGADRWRWDLHSTLQDFDPRPWWPFAQGSPWAKGPHRLNAKLDTKASAPLAALGLLAREPRNALAQFDGQLSLTMAPSQLAGVPLQGELQLDSRAAEPLTSQWQMAGNRLSLQARADASAVKSEHWQLAVQAPALAALVPLLALDEELKARVPTSGRLDLQASADGHEQAWQWQGRLQASALAGKGYQVDDITLTAQGGTSLDAPLNIQLKALGLRPGKVRVDLINATVSGSAREHQLAVQLESPYRPPEWFEQLLAARTGTGTRFQAAAAGRWLPDAGMGHFSPAGHWQGKITDLQGRARDGSGQPWLGGKDLRVSLALDNEGVLQSLSAEPGRIDLPGTGLRWSAAQFEARGTHPLPQINLQAQIEPFALAPLLARAQPELGWGGDLSLAGDIHVTSAERFDADLVFERRSGDLSVADDVHDPSSHIQTLGLTDLRLGLSAHDGTWYFTQAFAGKQLGEMAGVASVRTRADLSWPPANAPLDGVLQMRVANLSAWGAWVPPGWRLGGELTTSANLGGSFAHPEFTGLLHGSGLSAHNALLGVALSDGQVDLALRGDKAHIERFDFKGGDGHLKLQGDGALGESPQAQLTLDADHFRLLGRVDRRLITSGHATVLLKRDLIKAEARLKVDEGLFDLSRGGAPGLDDDVSVADGRARAAATPTDDTPATAPPKSGFAVQSTAVIDLGTALRIKASGLDTRLRGEIKHSFANGKHALNGKVRTDAGTYTGYGQKLDVERGELNFVGPAEDTQLDILAVRPNLDVKVGVAITGNAKNPRIRLASDPEMPEADKLSWLMLGRAPEGLGKADTALLQRAAMALLAGEGEAPTDALMKTLGITDFSVRQSSEGDVRDTVVSIGSQLSRHWYVGYERGVNATTGTWQLIYRLAQRFTLRAQSGTDNAVDLIWNWRLQ